MIQKISLFLFILYTITIILTHWGTSLILVAIILGRTLSYVGKRRKGVTLFLSTLSKIFYSTDISNRVSTIFTFVFYLIAATNLTGLYVYNQHMLLSSVILVLMRLVLYLWIFSYRRYFNKGWIYLTNTLIVNITYPSLSLLLSNIEILTHIFRPLTLSARIWVNIWVGHSMLSILSFYYIKRFYAGFGSWFSILLFPTVQRSLFLYELMITLLQSSVIVYLSYVYYRDNLSSTIEHNYNT